MRTDAPIRFTLEEWNEWPDIVIDVSVRDGVAHIVRSDGSVAMVLSVLGPEEDDCLASP